MNKFSLGTANFGLRYGVGQNKKKTSFREIKKIFKYLKKKKSKSLDTALVYKNEKNLKKINLKDWKITTKFPKIPSKKNFNIEKEVFNYVESFLTKNKIKKLYGLLLHDSSDLIKSKKNILYKTLNKLKKKKLVKKIGVSVYDLKETDSLLKNYKIDIIQLPLNIIDRRFAEHNYLKKLKEKNIEIHIRSIFLKGLLLLNKKNIPSKFKKWNKTWDEWDEWTDKNKFSKLEACINYVNSFKEIDRIIVGVNNCVQLKEILSVFQNRNKKINFKKIFNHDNKLIDPRSW